MSDDRNDEARHEDGELVFFGSAQKFFELAVYDAQRMHLVTVRLTAQEGTTPGDMQQLQQFFWQTLGQDIRDTPELQDHLRAGGFEVFLDDPKAQEPPPEMGLS